MTIDSKILGMTTIIECKSKAYNYVSQGTGFYYAELEQEDPAKVDTTAPRWRKIESVWLITNRHVVLPKVKQADGSTIETIPDVFRFNMREEKNGKVEWVPIELSKDELLKRTKLHADASIDIAAINVNDLQVKIVMDNPDKQFIGSVHLTNDNLPSNKQPSIEATSDIVVFSYPYGFYDQENKFPIIKSGIIASSWGANFNGSPHFLIDAKLFPGSSGGLVISKPLDLAIIDGKLLTSKDKRYTFLGIYSGEYTHTDSKGEKESFGLGIVWYSYLVPQIINEGVSPVPK